MTENFKRIPAILRLPEAPAFTETYGFAGSQGYTFLEGQLLLPEVRSRVLHLFMHPTSTLQLLPVPEAMANAGFHVLCAASRYPRNDAALIMEKVVLDLGAWVRWAKDSLGYDKVVLVGWSGGGSLSLFYQAEAEQPSIIFTPSGDRVDLAGAALPLADGIVFVAAHLSRAETLTEWLDPSVLDEVDPDRRDRELDIYDLACPNKPPFSATFIKQFRAAQVARNARITAWCRETLDELGRRGGAEYERGFVVHRTMCDPRWIDPALDPSDRRPNWCYLGDPRTANVGTAGLARYSSLRSWLSQWSLSASHARSRRNAPLVGRVPVLQIENTADDAVPATHNPLVHNALSTPDKEYVRIGKATHYYVGQPELLQRCVSIIGEWTARKVAS